MIKYTKTIYKNISFTFLTYHKNCKHVTVTSSVTAALGVTSRTAARNISTLCSDAQTAQRMTSKHRDTLSKQTALYALRNTLAVLDIIINNWSKLFNIPHFNPKCVFLIESLIKHLIMITQRNILQSAVARTV